LLTVRCQACLGRPDEIRPNPGTRERCRGLQNPGLIKSKAPLVQAVEVRTTDDIAEWPGEVKVLTGKSATLGKEGIDQQFRDSTRMSGSGWTSDVARGAPLIETSQGRGVGRSF
jgi:hypothetical protein